MGRYPLLRKLLVVGPARTLRHREATTKTEDVASGILESKTVKLQVQI